MELKRNDKIFIVIVISMILIFAYFINYREPVESYQYNGSIHTRIYKSNDTIDLSNETIEKLMIEIENQGFTNINYSNTEVFGQEIKFEKNNITSDDYRMINSISFSDSEIGFGSMYMASSGIPLKSRSDAENLTNNNSVIMLEQIDGLLVSFNNLYDVYLDDMMFDTLLEVINKKPYYEP